MPNDEITSALVDLVTAIEDGRTSQAEISATLVDILDVLREQVRAEKKEEATPVNVTVQPAPVTPSIQVHPPPVHVPPPTINVTPAPIHIDAHRPWDAEITHEWEGERIVRSFVKRIKPKGSS